MVLSGKYKALACLTLTSSILITGCSSNENNNTTKNITSNPTKKVECNNLPFIPSEKNLTISYLDSFPKIVKSQNDVKSSITKTVMSTSESPKVNNTNKEKISLSNSPTGTTNTNITPTSAPSINTGVSNVGAEKSTPSGKPSESYTTDARGIIKDKHGLIVGIKTEASTFGSGVIEDSSKFKKSNISTIGINLSKGFEMPKFYIGSQNVFDPELTTGYKNTPYKDKKYLSLTPEDEKNLTAINNIITHNSSINASYNESDCKVNFSKVIVNSGDHGARVHVSPSYSAASYGVAANYSTLEGYYINSGWFRITSGPLKYGYVNSALIDSNKLSNGEISSSKLVKIPEYLRKNTKNSSSEYLNPIAARQLILMNSAYRKTFHTNLKLNEGYRPLSTQLKYWKSLPSGVAAKPGSSNHGLALSMDINGIVFQNTQDRWLSIYSQAFGWDRPDYFDRYGSERWHYNFIG